MEEQPFELPEEPKNVIKNTTKETTPTSADRRQSQRNFKVTDKNLQEEAERAKNQLLKELNSMNVKDVNFEDVTD